MVILWTLLRRLRDLLIVLFVVGTTLFFIVRLIPGDPAVAILGDTATPDQLERLREQLGLNGPLWQQYVIWLGNVVRGDFGDSQVYGDPVLEVILGRLPVTLTLAVFSIVISFVIALLITVWNAARPQNRFARLILNTAPVGFSVPGFWIALLLILVFAVWLRWVPPGGYVPLFEDPARAIPLLILPVATLCIGQTAQFTLVLRESIAGELSHLYLRTARSKGIGEFVVVFRHVLPNALLPIITVLGLDFALLIGGVAIIETVFLVPGLGSMLLTAVAQRDYALIQGAALFIAFIFVVINLIVDLLYAVVDPKVRVR